MRVVLGCLLLALLAAVVSVEANPQFPHPLMRHTTAATTMERNKNKGSGLLAAGTNFTKLWSTELYDVTMPTNKSGWWEYDPGFSASCAGLYLTTDVNGTFYVIDTNTGDIQWTYNDWPALDYKVERSRQIVGTANYSWWWQSCDVVAVLRHETLYAFNASSSALLWTQHFPKIAEKTPSLMTTANHLLITWVGVLQVLDAHTGELLWGTDSLIKESGYSTSQSVVFTGDGLVAAVVQTNINEYAVRVYDGATGIIKLQHYAHASDAGNIYLFHVSSDYFLYFHFATTPRIVRVDMTGAKRFDVAPGLGSFGGYGFGDGYFYSHFSNCLVSFNLSTGAIVAKHDVPSNIEQNGILGYPNWVNILMIDSTTGATNLTGYAASDMRKLWSMPLKSDQPYMYGNWPGSLVVASTKGDIEIVDGRTGHIVGNLNGGYAPLNPQSIVFGDSHIYLTYGKKVVGFKFTPYSP